MKEWNQIRLHTSRLTLSPVQLADAKPLHEHVYSDGEVMKFITGHPSPSLEVTRGRVEKMLEHWEQHGFGFFSVRLTTGEFVGRCGIQHLDGTDEVEIGYTFAQDFWGHGIATEASRAVINFAFDEVGLEEIVSVAVPDNQASWRVMEKLGMSYEGRSRAYGKEVVRYALERQDWNG